jgi:hypothetical protein
LQLKKGKLKPAIMNTRVMFPLILCLLVGVFCLGMGKPSGHGRSKAVEINKDYIFIPGTTISAEDQTAVKQILKKYDRSFYRIEPYEKGTPKKHIGTMDEMEVGHGFSRDFAKSSGFTTWTTKIGRGCSPTRCTQSPTPPAGAGRTCKLMCPDPSDSMVREVTPILQKYSK